ncbi:MAG: hypothetical protein WCK18_15855 [Prolixibacteraceae bacterium]
MYHTNFISNVLFEKQGKGNKKQLRPKTKAINSIVAFLRSKGLKAEGVAKTSKAFADVMATLAGKPLEVKVGARRLSPAQLNYKRAIDNAGGLYVVTTNAEDFKAWYRDRETVKNTMP